MDTERTRYGSEKAGLLCAYAFRPASAGRTIDAGEAAGLVAGTATDQDVFVWLHFNLSNQASQRWLNQHLALPDAFFSGLQQTSSTRVEIAPGWIVAAFSDLTIFGPDASEAAPMVVFVSERTLVTARRTPLRSVDRLRESVRRGDPFRSPVELFAHLLRDQESGLAQVVREATDKVDDIEDRLIANQVASSRSTLGALRRLLVKVQRLLAPIPSALFRLLAKPPAWIGADDRQELRETADEIAAAASECSALVDRIKLLQDEVYAVVSEQTNRTLFTLTIVTVLALPMTIVSGFFGMNVSGVPFQHGGGFWMVVILTVAASAAGAIVLFRGRRRS